MLDTKLSNQIVLHEESLQTHKYGWPLREMGIQVSGKAKMKCSVILCLSRLFTVKKRKCACCNSSPAHLVAEFSPLVIAFLNVFGNDMHQHSFYYLLYIAHCHANNKQKTCLLKKLGKNVIDHRSLTHNICTVFQSASFSVA